MEEKNNPKNTVIKVLKLVLVELKNSLKDDWVLCLN